MKTRSNIHTFLLFTIAVLFLSTSAAAQEHKHEKKDSAKTEMHMHHEMENHDDSVDSDSLKSESPWNSLCPVMGGEVDPEVATVMYEGKAYGFCCKGCDKKFKKDPAKYSKNLSEDGKTFQKAE